MHRSFKTRNPMALPEFEQCRECCIEQLSGASAMYAFIKEAHWNVKGVNALDTHRYLDEVADLMLAHADLMGERVVQLGGFAMVDPARVSLPGLTRTATTSPEWIAEIADNLASCIGLLHGHIGMTGEKGDLVTQNILLDMAQDAEKHLMFLEMTLQG